MERRLERLARHLPPLARQRLDLSALSDEELEELSWFAWYVEAGEGGAHDLPRLTPAQRERITALARKARSGVASSRSRDP